MNRKYGNGIVQIHFCVKIFCGAQALFFHKIYANKWLYTTVCGHNIFFVTISWRRTRDLNPRASFLTYSLSRGAPSPLGYFSKGAVQLSIFILKKWFAIWRRGRDSNSWSLAGSLVFKTSSLNHSDTSPTRSIIIPYYCGSVNAFLQNFCFPPT